MKRRILLQSKPESTTLLLDIYLCSIRKNAMDIPPFTTKGVLPPLLFSRARSPYPVSLPDVVQSFGTTEHRQAMLEKFLTYRGRVHATGLIRGFQWIDGSFVEDIEEVEGRPPKDIDIVTFYHLPHGETAEMVISRDPPVFADNLGNRRGMKEDYNVDVGAFVNLAKAPEELVQIVGFWHSLYSHRRDERWKGFLQIDLDPTEDNEALARLRAMAGAEVDT